VARGSKVMVQSPPMRRSSGYAWPRPRRTAKTPRRGRLSRMQSWNGLRRTAIAAAPAWRLRPVRWR